MVQKRTFKVFVWFLATFFFFMASGVIISLLKPGPSENEVMQFMSGMMGAMERSIMGVTMEVDNNQTIGEIIAYSYFMLTPIIAVSVVLGFALRLMRRSDKSV